MNDVRRASRSEPRPIPKREALGWAAASYQDGEDTHNEPPRSTEYLCRAGANSTCSIRAVYSGRSFGAKRLWEMCDMCRNSRLGMQGAKVAIPDGIELTDPFGCIGSERVSASSRSLTV